MVLLSDTRPVIETAALSISVIAPVVCEYSVSIRLSQSPKNADSFSIAWKFLVMDKRLTVRGLVRNYKKMYFKYRIKNRVNLRNFLLHRVCRGNNFLVKIGKRQFTFVLYLVQREITDICNQCTAVIVIPIASHKEVLDKAKKLWPKQVHFCIFLNLENRK